MANTTISPNPGVLNLSLSANLVVIVGALALAGFAPTVSNSGINTVINPTSGALIVTTSGIGGTVNPAAGSLGFAGGTVTQTLTLPPPSKGVLALIGAAPNVVTSQGITPTAGVLILQPSPAGVNGVFPPFAPLAGSLTLTGYAPIINQVVPTLSNTGGSGISYDDNIGVYSGISGSGITRDKSITKNLT